MTEMRKNLLDCFLKIISNDIDLINLDLISEISELMSILRRQEQIKKSLTTYL